MKKWTDLGFECVDEGRPVYIKNGNPYTVIGPKGEERMQSLSLLSKKRKDELMLTLEVIEEFETWAKNAHNASKTASAKQNHLEKKDKSRLKTDDNVPTDYTAYDRNKQIAKDLGFEETQNGLFTKIAIVNACDHNLYLDFRNSIKGSFYSYSNDDEGGKFSNEELKKMGQKTVLKYIAARDEEQTTVVPQSDVVVETRPVPSAYKTTLEALKERNQHDNKLITHNIPLEQDIDYYMYGKKAILGKEGIMKLASGKGISTDVLIEVDEPKYKKVRVTAWYFGENGNKTQAIDYCDWDWDVCYMRTIIKAVEKKKIPKEDIIYKGKDIVGVADRSLVKLASYFVDAREFALRTVIGKAKRRCWGELLGITTASKKELELMREQYDRIHGED